MRTLHLNSLFAPLLLSALLLVGCDSQPQEGPTSSSSVEAKQAYRAEMEDRFKALELDAAKALDQIQRMPQEHERTAALDAQLERLAMTVRSAEEMLAVYDDTWKLDWAWDDARAKLDAAVAKLDRETGALLDAIGDAQQAFRDDQLAALTTQREALVGALDRLRQLAGADPANATLAAAVTSAEAALRELKASMQALRSAKVSEWHVLAPAN